MLVVSGDTITATRADDFMLHIDIIMQDGEIYDIDNSSDGADILTFYLYKKPSKLKDNPPVFKRDFQKTEFGNEVSINSSDTQFLSGNKYYYACVLDSVKYGRNTVSEGELYLTY